MLSEQERKLVKWLEQFRGQKVNFQFLRPGNRKTYVVGNGHAANCFDAEGDKNLLGYTVTEFSVLANGGVRVILQCGTQLESTYLILPQPEEKAEEVAPFYIQTEEGMITVQVQQ